MSLCAEKKFFFIGLLCMSWKSLSFPQTKSFSFAESFTNFTQSRFLHTKTSFARTFLRCTQKISIFTNQKFFFCTNLSLLPSKAILFHPPPPIRTTLNLLSTKEYSCSFHLCSKSLRCNAWTSHRFKSLPAIPGEVAVFRKTGYLMKAGHFRKNTLSTGDLNRPRSPEVRKPLVYFWFFSYTRKE